MPELKNDTWYCLSCGKDFPNWFTAIDHEIPCKKKKAEKEADLLIKKMDDFLEDLKKNDA